MDVRYMNVRPVSRIRYPIIVQLLLLLQSIRKPLSGFATAVQWIVSPFLLLYINFLRDKVDKCSVV